jgi:hypothetical protein
MPIGFFFLMNKKTQKNPKTLKKFNNAPTEKKWKKREKKSTKIINK